MAQTFKLQQRAKLREQFKKSFDDLVTSKAFKSIMINNNLGDYEFEILSEKHRDEAIHILSQQFSTSGGALPPSIFDMTYQDRIPLMTPIVDHAIDTGLSFVSLDKKDGKVCTVCICFDEMDFYEPSQETKDKLPEKYNKLLEMVYTMILNDPWYKLIVQLKTQGRLKIGAIFVVSLCYALLEIQSSVWTIGIVSTKHCRSKRKSEFG